MCICKYLVRAQRVTYNCWQSSQGKSGFGCGTCYLRRATVEILHPVVWFMAICRVAEALAIRGCIACLAYMSGGLLLPECTSNVCYGGALPLALSRWVYVCVWACVSKGPAANLFVQYSRALNTNCSKCNQIQSHGSGVLQFAGVGCISHVYACRMVRWRSDTREHLCFAFKCKSVGRAPHMTSASVWFDGADFKWVEWERKAHNHTRVASGNVCVYMEYALPRTLRESNERTKVFRFKTKLRVQ